MSKQTICTVDALLKLLKKRLSQKRYIHCLGVAITCEELLTYYKCTDYEKQWNNFSAGIFCGLVHDLAREMSDEEILKYCNENNIVLTPEMLSSPVLAHGNVSAHIARQYIGPYPVSWQRAIEVHTTGDKDMNCLASALFVADFIEPSRSFMTEEKRKSYLSNATLEGCEYTVLCDMMEHWKQKNCFNASQSTLELYNKLKIKLGKK